MPGIALTRWWPLLPAVVTFFGGATVMVSLTPGDRAMVLGVPFLLAVLVAVTLMREEQLRDEPQAARAPAPHAEPPLSRLELARCDIHHEPLVPEAGLWIVSGPYNLAVKGEPLRVWRCLSCSVPASSAGPRCEACRHAAHPEKVCAHRNESLFIVCYCTGARPV